MRLLLIRIALAVGLVVAVSIIWGDDAVVAPTGGAVAVVSTGSVSWGDNAE